MQTSILQLCNSPFSLFAVSLWPLIWLDYITHFSPELSLGTCSAQFRWLINFFRFFTLRSCSWLLDYYFYCDHLVKKLLSICLLQIVSSALISNSNKSDLISCFSALSSISCHLRITVSLDLGYVKLILTQVRTSVVWLNVFQLSIQMKLNSIFILLNRVEEGDYYGEDKVCPREKYWQVELIILGHGINRTWDWCNTNKNGYGRNKK